MTPTPGLLLYLVIGKSNSMTQVGSPINAIDNWVGLRVKFLLDEDRMIFYTPDTFYVQEHIGLRNNEPFKIIFGANDYENFKTSDVPSFCLLQVPWNVPSGQSGEFLVIADGTAVENEHIVNKLQRAIEITTCLSIEVTPYHFSLL